MKIRLIIFIVARYIYHKMPKRHGVRLIKKVMWTALHIKSFRRISRIYKISHSTVARWIRLYKNHPDFTYQKLVKFAFEESDLVAKVNPPRRNDS